MYFYTNIVGVILLIIIIARTNSLSAKIQKLNSEIQKLKSTTPAIKSEQTNIGRAENPSSPLSSTMNPTSAQIINDIATTQAQKQEAFIPKNETQLDDGHNWLKENLLLKIGVLMILIGFGWFISYAFVHNWIGPVGRVALGFITGAGLALFGTMRMSKNLSQGTTFLILGSGITVVTAFASQAVYNFFSPTVALLIPFVVGLYVATVGATYNEVKIGVYAVVLGFLAPILTHTTNLDQNLLFIYLLVTSCSCLWLAFRKDWGVINLLSLVGVFIYSLSFMTSSVENNFILGILFLLNIIYFIVSMAETIYAKKEIDNTNLFVAIANGLFIFLLIYNKILPEFQSIFCVIWMVIFGLGSMLVFTKTKKVNFFYVYSLIAVALLGEATAFELSGSKLILAFALESFAVTIGSYIVTRSAYVGLKMSSFMIIPGLMALPILLSSSSYLQKNHTSDLLVVFLISILFITLGYFYNKNLKEKNEEESKLSKFHIVVGSLFILRLIWLFLGIVFISQKSLSITMSLVVYTIIGIVAYFNGNLSNKKATKKFGAGLLGFVILRLLTVDVWTMPLASRIVVFILIGILFISTAFIIKKDKKNIIANQ